MFLNWTIQNYSPVYVFYVIKLCDILVDHIFLQFLWRYKILLVTFYTSQRYQMWCCWLNDVASSVVEPSLWTELKRKLQISCPYWCLGSITNPLGPIWKTLAFGPVWPSRLFQRMLTYNPDHNNLFSRYTGVFLAWWMVTYGPVGEWVFVDVQVHAW